MPYKYQELSENKFHIHVAKEDISKLHGHDFLEFTFIARGTMEHEINGKSSVLTAGDYFIVDYGTKHAYHSVSGEPLEVVNLLFYPEFVEHTLAGSRSFEDVVNSYLLRFSYKTLRSSPTGETFRDDSGRIRQIVEELMEEYRKKNHGYIEYIRCLFVQMLIITMRKVGKQQQGNAKSDVVRGIAEYVKTNYARKIYLADMARQYNYSVSFLSRKFTSEMGVGFSEYLQRIRIEQSCRLLENSDLHIHEVAMQVGYDNVKFFNQIFKQTLRISPRQFRQMRK
jgi:AraC-like DNA-binding protein